MPPPAKRPFTLSRGFRCPIRSHPSGQVVPCTVSRRLAEGGKASVYLARRSDDGAPLVLKTSRWRQRAPDPDLRVEQRILEGLSHANLVRYQGSCTLEHGQLVLASERLFTNPLLVLNTPSIRRHFPNDLGNHYYPLPPSVALALSIDLLRGLEYLHRHGFVHHDVKLGNLLVRVEPAPAELEDADLLDRVIAGRCTGVLIDLGGTRSRDYLRDLEAGKVDPSIVPPQLTPVYAPPESLRRDRAERRMHPSLDVYAAAIAIYTSVSGRRAYDHLQLDPNDLRQLLRAKRDEAQGSLLPISFEALGGVPGIQAIAADLYGFLSACLHRRPEERPTPGQARKYLEGLLRLFTRDAPRVPGGAPAPPAARDPNLLFGTTSGERRRNRDQARRRGP